MDQTKTENRRWVLQSGEPWRTRHEWVSVGRGQSLIPVGSGENGQEELGQECCL